MTTILVIGRRGQVATELARTTWPVDASVIALGRNQLNVADADAVRNAITAVKPRILINASAYTAVDRAEDEPELAFLVNEAGPRHLATEAARRGIPLIHLSTDYVFSGRSERPWREDDAPAPRGVYARSKLEGERAIRDACPQHVILRTSWVFAAHGQNFVRTMLRLGAERDELTIVNDQLGCPTSAADLARVIAAICRALLSRRDFAGTYHYAGSGPVTWHGFAAAIFAAAGDLACKPPSLRPVSTAAFGARAPRPAYSVLDCGKIKRVFGISPRPWLSELCTVLDEIRRYRPVLAPADGIFR
jgi:dTDP-4-dehydrorhamnose reductase